MKTNRRDFLKGLGVAAAAEMASGCSVFTGAASDFDETLAVLLADPHVSGVDEGWTLNWTFTRDVFSRRVAEILAMRPLPRRGQLDGTVRLQALANASPRERGLGLERSGNRRSPYGVDRIVMKTLDLAQNRMREMRLCALHGAVIYANMPSQYTGKE